LVFTNQSNIEVLRLRVTKVKTTDTGSRIYGITRQSDLEASCFKQKNNKWDHAVNTQKLAERARKSREAFMRHYYKKYDEALPPAWVAVEAMTLGELSKWYENLQHGADRNAIAHKFDLDETNFAPFLQHLNSLDRPAMQSLTHNGCFCFLVTSRHIHPTQSLAPDCV
jgi:hypothetical protein